MIKHYNHPPGIVLLLALLVLAVLLASSLTIATLINREFSATSTSDRGITAYYAAESGLEQALYGFRVKGKTKNELNVALGDAVNMSSSGARWWREVKGVKIDEIPFLKQDDTVQYDFIGPTTQLSNSITNQLAKIKILPVDSLAWIEVTRFDFLGGAIKVEKSFIPPGKSFDVLNASTLTRLRLRALYSNISNLKVKMCGDLTCSDDNLYELPSRVVITTTGEKGNTRQALSVTVSRYEPQVEVFDFTIFSECSILKGNASSVIPCT